MTVDLHLDDVFTAARRIAGTARTTPMHRAPQLESDYGAIEVHLKLESLQNTGAFKVRGASNRILSLDEESRVRGVITFSTGNHGKAVAYVARSAGIPALVCMSEHVPAYRAEAIAALGAEVVIHGHSQDEAEERYYQIMDERGMAPVVPFDDPYVIAGQGTIALEMLTASPNLDMILVPLSGGGLLAGIALAAKAIKPSITIVGVSIERSPAMLESVRAGHPVAVEERDTLADSLLGGVGVENTYTLPIISRLVDEHVLITEDEIERGIVYAFLSHSLVVEGSAAVGIAAIQSKKVDVRGKRVGVVVSGSSVDPGVYLCILEKHIQQT
jgi:threonine dehydratase